MANAAQSGEADVAEDVRGDFEKVVYVQKVGVAVYGAGGLGGFEHPGLPGHHQASHGLENDRVEVARRAHRKP